MSLAMDLGLGSHVRRRLRSCPDCGYQFWELAAYVASFSGGRGVRARVLVNHDETMILEVCPGCRRVSTVDNTIAGVRTLISALRGSGSSGR